MFRYSAYLLVIILLFCSKLNGQGTDSLNQVKKSNYHWEQVSIEAGLLMAGINTEISLERTPYSIIQPANLEEEGRYNSTIGVFIVEAHVNFGKKRKNDLNFGYCKIMREGRTLTDINPFGPDMTEKSEFTLQIVKGLYSYNYYMSDRLRLAASTGLYALHMYYKIYSLTRIKREHLSLLPVLGLQNYFAITPNLKLGQSIALSYLKFNEFEGSLVDAHITLDYLPIKYLGIGIDLTAFKTNISDYKREKI